MLKPSTVSICRTLLRDEIALCNMMIHKFSEGLVFVSSRPEHISPQGREQFLNLWNMREKMRSRKAKMEKAIRDLKANMETGKKQS